MAPGVPRVHVVLQRHPDGHADGAEGHYPHRFRGGPGFSGGLAVASGGGVHDVPVLPGSVASSSAIRSLWLCCWVCVRLWPRQHARRSCGRDDFKAGYPHAKMTMKNYENQMKKKKKR